LLKDIVAIHSLPPEAERTLMIRIAGVVSPGTEVELPPLAATDACAQTSPAFTKQFKYSPPMRALVEEHVLIKRLVALIPSLLQIADVDDAGDRQLLMDGVDFIRSYADRFHHAKEEDILFIYFDEGREIIQAMLTDHETARAHVRRLAEAVEGRDKESVAEHLSAYGKLLSAHIKKEDDPHPGWIGTHHRTGRELFSRFAAVDAAAEVGFTELYERTVTRIEEAIASRAITGVITHTSEVRK
jgi:hypothetical protein